MNPPQTLQTIAEIGVAFAGFSGLVIAFRRKAGPLSAVHKYRLRVLLALGFAAMFLSLLPDLLSGTGLPSATLWRLAGATALTFSCAFLGWWLTASWRMMRLVPEIFHAAAVLRMTAGHFAIILLLLASVAGVTGKGAMVAYQAALIWYLLHAAQQFSRMLFIQPRARDLRAPAAEDAPPV